MVEENSIDISDMLSQEHVKVVAWNIHCGLHTKIDQINKLLKEEQADILFLFETSLPDNSYYMHGRYV